MSKRRTHQKHKVVHGIIGSLGHHVKRPQIIQRNFVKGRLKAVRKF